MSEKDDLPFLPTRHGTPMGERHEREQRAQVGPESIRRVQRDNLDGSTTVLHTRGGSFEYVTTKPEVEEEIEERFDWAYSLHPIKKDGEAYVEDVWTNYGPHAPIVDYQYGAKWRRKGLVTRTDGAYSWKLMEASYDGEIDKKKAISGYHHWISSKFIVTWTDYTRFKFNDFISLNGVAKVIRVYDRRSKTWRKPIVLEYVKNNADPSTTKIVSACCVSTSYGVRVRAVKQTGSYGYFTVSDYTLDGVHVGSRDFTYSSYSYSGYTMESVTLNRHSFSQDGTRFLAVCMFRVGTGYLVNSGIVEFLSPPPTKTGETFPVTVAAVHTFDEWAIGGSGGGGTVYANPITRCHTPGFSKDGKVCYLKTITGMVTTEAGAVEIVYCPALFAGELTNWNSECTESTELIENGISIYSHSYTWHKTDTNTILSQWTDTANATIDCPEPQMYRVERRIKWEDRVATLQMHVSYYKMSLVVLHPANRNEGEFTSEWIQVRDYGHWGGGIVSTDDSNEYVNTGDFDLSIYKRLQKDAPLSLVSKKRIRQEGLNYLQDYPVWDSPEADTWYRWSGWNPVSSSLLYMFMDYTIVSYPYNRKGTLYKGGTWYDVVTDERDPLFGVDEIWASVDIGSISPFG